VDAEVEIPGQPSSSSSSTSASSSSSSAAASRSSNRGSSGSSSSGGTARVSKFASRNKALAKQTTIKKSEASKQQREEEQGIEELLQQREQRAARKQQKQLDKMQRAAEVEEEEDKEVDEEDASDYEDYDDATVKERLREAMPYIRSTLLNERSGRSLMEFWQQGHMHCGSTETAIVFTRLHYLLASKQGSSKSVNMNNIMSNPEFGKDLTSELLIILPN
jgi:hypothetical protein